MVRPHTHTLHPVCALECGPAREIIMLSTPLCAILGIDHPVLNAPMAGTATADLAAAVSIAGGFGMLGGTSRGGSDWLRAQIRAVRAKTSRPFGVGFISSFPDTDDLVQVALEERVAAINHSFADPTPYVAPAHASGVRVFAQVQSVAQATARGARRRGCDHCAGNRGRRAHRIGRHAGVGASGGGRGRGHPGCCRRRHRRWQGTRRRVALGCDGRLARDAVRGQPGMGRWGMGTAGGSGSDSRRHGADQRL